MQEDGPVLDRTNDFVEGAKGAAVVSREDGG